MRLTQGSEEYAVANFQLSEQSLTALHRLLGIVLLRGQVWPPWGLQNPIENRFLFLTPILANTITKTTMAASSPSFPFCSLFVPNGPPRAAVFGWF